MTLFSDAKKIHFVGIGGIGTSALAQWCLARGVRVSGSNVSDEPILVELKKRGAKIRVGKHRAANIPKGTELLVYTLAALTSNPERVSAVRRGIPAASYPEALGELSRNKFTIAVSGSHGKSTTASMAALTLRRAGFDPTVIIGTRLREFGNTNCRIGRSKYLVIEADEWQGAFWNYSPDIVLLTNIDREHLDFYKDFRGVRAGFQKFVGRLPEAGLIIANGDDTHTRKVAEDSGKPYRFYSAKNKDAAKIRRVIKIPGAHNVSNASAVLALAKTLRIPERIALRTIGDYRGSWRRMEYRGKVRGAKLFDDYAHHPTEIRATLTAARTLLGEGGKLFCVFQPHQYERLRLLFTEFAASFGDADRVIILPTYAVRGREASVHPRITSETLVRHLSKRAVSTSYAPTFRTATAILKRELRRNDVCILMGAGDIVKMHAFLHTG